jgi:PAS domain S-box-containing protein
MRHVQKSDECFRRIFEDGPLGIAIVSSDHQFIKVNKTFCEMVGYTEQELFALTFLDLIHPEDFDKNVQLAQQLFGGEGLSHKEERLIRKDGQIRWINLTTSIIRDEAETSSYGLVMVEDITQHKQMEIERERLYKRIFQTERLATIGRLTSSLSHAISNPMQAIQGALNLALEELENPSELANFLHLSLKESEQVIQLLSRLRYAYLPKAQAVEIFDLNPLLQEAIALARRELKRQSVTLQTNLAPDPPPLTAVAGQLYLVFLSLLLNLSDAIGAAGGGELRLNSYALPQMVQIEFSTNVSVVPDRLGPNRLGPNRLAPVADEPVGVSKEEVFTNLGLSFSHDIVVAHNGTMDISQQDGGITCSIELPCSAPDLPESQ